MSYKEVIKQAIPVFDALIEKWYATRESGALPLQVVKATAAIKMMREALAQPDLEPEALFSVNDYGRWEETDDPNGTPLYTAQAVQTLTDRKLLMITTAYEQGVGKGIQRCDCNPYAEGTDEHRAWAIGYKEGLLKQAVKKTTLREALESLVRA